MNFISRFLGIFVNPAQTAKALAEKPIWVDALIVLLVFSAVFSYFTMPYQQQDSYQMMKDNVKFRERMGDESFEKYLDNMRNPSKSSIMIRSFLLAPFTLTIGFLFQCLILLGMGKMTSTEGKYVPILALFLHARFIDAGLGGMLRMILVTTKRSFFETSTSLAVFFPKMEITSTAFIILSQFDFFQLWAYGIIGLGLANIFKFEPRKGLTLAYVLWAAKTAVYIAIAFISRTFMM